MAILKNTTIGTGTPVENDQLLNVGNFFVVTPDKISLDKDFSISGSGIITGNVCIDGELILKNKLYAEGPAEINGISIFNDKITVNNDADITGKLNIGESKSTSDIVLSVSGASNFSGKLNIDNAAEINETLTVKKNIDVNNNLNVDGKLTAKSDTEISGKLTVRDGEIDILENTTSKKTITIDGLTIIIETVKNDNNEDVKTIIFE